MSALEELGLPSSATAEQVRDRFRELAKEHHPDHGGDPVVFRKWSELRDKALEEVVTTTKSSAPCPKCEGRGYVERRRGLTSVRVLCECGVVESEEG